MKLKKTVLRWFITTEILEELQTKVYEIQNIKEKHKHLNRYLYTVHRVITHYTRNKNNEKYLGCPITEGRLGDTICKDYSYTAKMLKDLVKWNIIHVTRKPFFESFGKNNTSTVYAINPRFSLDSILVYEVSNENQTFIKRLMESDEDNLTDTVFCRKTFEIFKNSISINNEGLKYLNNKYNLSLLLSITNNNITTNNNINNNNYINNNNQQSLLLLNVQDDENSAILTQKGRKIGREISKKIRRGLSIEQRDFTLFSIYLKDFYCVRPDSKSRVYTNLTNLPGDHRKYIDFNGSRMLMTDISNSQILLSVPVVIKKYKVLSGKGIAGLPKDVLKFKELTETGKFYEDFGRMLCINPTGGEVSPELRKLFKKEIFRQIWFGRNGHSAWKIKDGFKKQFPTVFKMIWEIKKGDHSRFAVELQRFEASILIDEVAKKMIRAGKKVLTLHDAVICSCEADLADAERRISNALAKYNICPKFKRE